MPEQRYRSEKEEKEEKEEKGREEKEEKGKEEKWRRDPLSGVVFGLIVIAVGVLFLLASQETIDWDDWWAYLLLTIGAIFIFEVVLRSIMPAYRKPISGRLIAGIILLAIGAANIYSVASWWPLIIIGGGVFILFNALFRSRK
jgi:cation transport ATPase